MNISVSNIFVRLKMRFYAMYSVQAKELRFAVRKRFYQVQTRGEADTVRSCNIQRNGRPARLVRLQVRRASNAESAQDSIDINSRDRGSTHLHKYFRILKLMNVAVK